MLTTRTMQTPTTDSRRPLRRKMAALGAAGAMALTGLGITATTTTAAEAAPVSASASQAAPQYVAINQFATGLPTQAVDCGPAAAVSAMLAEGHTPQSWDPANPGAAVSVVRNSIGTNGATVESEVTAGIAAQNAPVRDDTDFTGALDQVKAGKTAIMNGNMQSLPYSYNYPNPDVQHWITVSDYNAADGTFLALDSNDGGQRRVTQAGLDGFQASAPNQWQVVVG